MNIYDFDGTIYAHDSSAEFFKFCIKKNKKCLLIIPKLFFITFFYLVKIIEKESLKSCFFSFVKYFSDIDSITLEFWENENYKLKKFYMNNRNKNDVIVSASPRFILEPVSKKYNFKLIATEVDKNTGKLISKNCYGIEKVRRLEEENIFRCDSFYTDSLSDRPVSKLARKSYIVRDQDLIDFNKYKPSIIKRIKTDFLFNRDFITFCAIGVINVINGVFIAYLYSNIITNSITSYILGFFTSLIISYILNSLLNFKEKISVDKFVKFIVSNIPNFLIQVFSVIVLINILELPKLISYFISAVIAVPITFVLVKINVFKNK